MSSPGAWAAVTWTRWASRPGKASLLFLRISTYLIFEKTDVTIGNYISLLHIHGITSLTPYDFYAKHAETFAQ